jgi:DNA-binding NarL/FixJ family response regulator
VSAIDTLRIVIIEDDGPTRDGLRLLIDGTPGFRCIGAFRTAEEALQARPPAPPNVVLLDVHLPGMSGTDAVSHFRERWPQSLVLMLTVFAEDQTVFTSLCRGASGYLLKKTPPARLLDAITEAAGGGAPMSPEIAHNVIRMFREFHPRQSVDATLTPIELRLLELLAEGFSYQGAGERLHVSINTIRTYIRTIYEKLHVHSKSEAVSKALKAGLI